MIVLTCKTPTDLWLELGRLFFHPQKSGFAIDHCIANRRFISIENLLTVEDWSSQWTGGALFDLVGYSGRGHKMNELRKTYVIENDWQKMKEFVSLNHKTEFFSIGMNFNMKLNKKGGCLSSFHIIKSRDTWDIMIHGKIAEIPRKFMADLVLVSNLIRELTLPTDHIRVEFMFSAMYFSIISLRAYVKVLGLKKKDFRVLPIMDPRNYQRNAWTAIENYAKKLKAPAWKDLNLETGEWKPHVSF